MLTADEFRQLLGRPESDTLDFKSAPYAIANDEEGRIKFVKDIICMSNTPREQAAFIITGVRKAADSTYELVGVDEHPDDADLQEQFTNRVHPLPRFSYYAFEFEGQSFGVVEIPPDRLGPCVPLKDFGGVLRRQQVYFRRGSSNAVAYPEDLRKIVAWMNGEPERIGSTRDDLPAWDQFLAAVHGFDPLYRYALLASPLRETAASTLSPLGRVPWAFVFDFDPDSETSGLLQGTGEELQESRGLHRVVRGEEPQIGAAGRSTFWFFALGLRGRSETIAAGPWRAWKMTYGQEIDRQAKALARATLPASLVCVVLWSDIELLRHVESVIENLLSIFGDQIEFVFVSDDGVALHSLAQDFRGTSIAISLPELCSGLRVFLQAREVTNEDLFLLPSRSGAPISIEKAELGWLSEDLELVHLNAGTVRPEGRAVCNAFLKGEGIDWYELGLNCDVERSIRERIERQVLRDLTAGRTVRLNLFHSPGAGGSTIARRIVWNLHRSYPCVVLRRTVQDETVERLYRIASRTAQSVLVISDSADIPDRQSEQLFDSLRSRQIPAVLLQVQRRFTETGTRERSFFLSAPLDDVELRRFVDIFTQLAPTRRAKLQEIATASDNRLHSAFYFGLTVFGRDFRGLASYVNTRLMDLDLSMRKIILYLSFVHHYSQNATPVDLFARLVGTRPVRLDMAISEGPRELLAEEESGYWRPIHELIALEVMEQMLTPGGRERRLWKQSISQIAVELIALFNEGENVPGEVTTEILHRMFVYRDNIDVIGSERAALSRFSHLLEDIPSRDGRLRVLQELVNRYPVEAHFWAHLGRFHSLEMRDPNKALECIDKAIALQDSDHLLHHMKGMILRKQMEQLISEKEKLDLVVGMAKEARACFERARSFDPEDEHGYISEVQMIAALMDYAGRSSQPGSFSYLKPESVDPLMREGLERAEDLLEQVRRNREGERASSFEIDCRGKLDALYGEHERALQAWDGLLSQPGVYRPPLRRQIIRTYLARRDRTWSNLKPKEIKRSLQLLADNLEEDPYNDRDLRLWLQAARYSPTPVSIEFAIERVAYWKTNAGTLDATYYLYVLHALLALEGSKLHLEEAELFMAECRQMARRRRNRTKSFEWLGTGEGLLALVHQSELGEWKEGGTDFWESTDRLKRISGRIAKIVGGQAGELEIEGGLYAFFVPGRGDFFRGKAENLAVSCYLGFSYDGLRAWDVRQA